MFDHRHKDMERENDLEGARRELENLKRILVVEKKHFGVELARKDSEIQDLKEQVLDEEREKETIMHAQLRVMAQHYKCPALISSLRKQLKEAEAAIELDDEVLEKSKDEAIALLEKQKQMRVDTLHRVKPEFSAISTEGLRHLPTPSLDDDHEAEAEDTKIKAGILSGIARLRKELAAAKKAHTATLRAKEDLITDLKANSSHLHEQLAEGKEKEEGLSVEISKQERLQKTWQEEKDELLKAMNLLAKKIEVLEGRDLEIAYLRNRLHQQLSEQQDKEIASRLIEMKSREPRIEGNLEQTTTELEEHKADLAERNKELASKDREISILHKQIKEIKSLRVSLPNPFEKEQINEGSIEYSTLMESRAGRMQLRLRDQATQVFAQCSHLHGAIIEYSKGMESQAVRMRRGLQDQAIHLLALCSHLEGDFARERRALEICLEGVMAQRLEEWCAFKHLVESSEADLGELQELRAKCGSSNSGLWCRDC
jgi:hypothetical protein